MPSFLQVLKHEGLRAGINFKAERMCMYNIRNMHLDARSKGFNMVAPDWKDPWWFKWASKLEWYTRPKRNK